ncbi:hypothetical protein EDD37DRAFT_510327 [Exophiala viscosa]|uniref:uncharacterized protein n=1 Tax=Exophiala viscosa TaxID=2486360 RepID=UPI00218FEAA5|nr:hypothetical protein EDD37DRAFT_510327 [Exophiala viscosa]
MLSQHSKSRDKYGIPIMGRRSIDRAEKIKQQYDRACAREKLLVSTAKIRVLLEQIAFVERWLMPYLRPLEESLAAPLASKSIDDTPDRLVEEEVAILTDMLEPAQQRWNEVAKAVSIIMTYTMRLVTEDFPDAVEKDARYRPSSLIRVWTDKSYCPYDADLGFRCPGWASGERFASFQDLQDRDILTTKSLRDHCENRHNTSNRSVWVSMTDDVSWVLEHAEQYRWDRTPDCRVALISTDRLDECNVLWDQSDTLVKRAHGYTWSPYRPDGVMYAWNGHFLAPAWIPEQCIVAI